MPTRDVAQKMGLLPQTPIAPQSILVADLESGAARATAGSCARSMSSVNWPRCTLTRSTPPGTDSASRSTTSSK